MAALQTAPPTPASNSPIPCSVHLHRRVASPRSGQGRVHRPDVRQAHRQDVRRALRPAEVPPAAGVLPGVQRELQRRGAAGRLRTAAGNIQGRVTFR